MTAADEPDDDAGLTSDEAREVAKRKQAPPKIVAIV